MRCQGPMLNLLLLSIGGPLQFWSEGNSVREMVSIFLWFGNTREVTVKVSYRSVKQLLSCCFWSILPSAVQGATNKRYKRLHNSHCLSESCLVVQCVEIQLHAQELPSLTLARNPTNLAELQVSV